MSLYMVVSWIKTVYSYIFSGDNFMELHQTHHQRLLWYQINNTMSTSDSHTLHMINDFSDDLIIIIFNNESILIFFILYFHLHLPNWYCIIITWWFELHTKGWWLFAIIKSGAPFWYPFLQESILLYTVFGFSPNSAISMTFASYFLIYWTTL